MCLGALSLCVSGVRSWQGGILGVARGAMCLAQPLHVSPCLVASLSLNFRGQGAGSTKLHFLGKFLGLKVALASLRLSHASSVRLVREHLPGQQPVRGRHVLEDEIPSEAS